MYKLASILALCHFTWRVDTTGHVVEVFPAGSTKFQIDYIFKVALLISHVDELQNSLRIWLSKSE